jgi:hypothetical protein
MLSFPVQVIFAAERCARGLRLLGKRSWQSEVGEEAAVEEPGDGRDAVALQREHQAVLTDVVRAFATALTADEFR